MLPCEHCKGIFVANVQATVQVHLLILSIVFKETEGTLGEE